MVRRIGTVALILVATIAPTSSVIAQETAAPPVLGPRAVRAELLQEIQLPGTDHFLRPSALFADRNAHEILIGDQGHNRVVILDENGTYRGEFYGQDRFTSPQDLVVEPDGTIDVLAGTREGLRILHYDFDGRFLNERALGTTPDGREVQPGALAIDSQGRLYVRDRVWPQVCVYRDGTLERVIEFAGDVPDDRLVEVGAGRITIAHDLLYIPVSTLGTVKVFDLDGRLLRAMGDLGSTPGQLALPVDVAVTGDGLVLVLDQNRFNVVCYSAEGAFLGEFGGKGISPGWFYRPSLLAIDSGNRVYVGQVYANRLQICRIPDFIAQGNRNLGERGRREDGGSVGNGFIQGSKVDAPRFARAVELVVTMQSRTCEIGG
ncbi:MAG: hypothetical protein KC729_08615 [Candidatus Eisenbacteria bacterium]|uniref:6-bladed beta-propeller n=1 Tax=Eiseniibacteriota bacterium TaxID=2212470 RepID=A0A956LYV3_UNCEI|nr:hypothetical protein [Candidatus Eisenbacteria bacterium]